MGPTLALTLCQHLTARVICGWRNIGTLVAPHARLVPTCDASRVGTNVATHAKPMPTVGASRVGTLVATQESCQLSANVDTGGGC